MVEGGLIKGGGALVEGGLIRSRPARAVACKRSVRYMRLRLSASSLPTACVRCPKPRQKTGPIRVTAARSVALVSPLPPLMRDALPCHAMAPGSVYI